MSHLLDGHLAHPRLLVRECGKHLFARVRRVDAPERAQGFVSNAPETVAARGFSECGCHGVIVLDVAKRESRIGAVRHVLRGL